MRDIPPANFRRQGPQLELVPPHLAPGESGADSGLMWHNKETCMSVGNFPPRSRGLRMVAVRIAVLGLCFLATILLGLWLRFVPRDRNGDMQIQVADKASYRLFVLGDTGSGSSGQMAVAQAMDARCNEAGSLDGIVLLGDLFYMDGVKSADDPQWVERIEKPYGLPCLSRSPIYPLLGNHDYRGNPSALIAYGKTHSRWQMPHRFYRVDFGSLLRLVAMDSVITDFCLLSGTCSADFLLESIRAPISQWTAVASHHPLASASDKGHSHSGGIFGFLLKPLVCDKVDAWFAGHAHHLEHRQEPGCNADLYVAGAGGGELNGIIAGQPASKFIRSSFGFIEILVSREQLTVSMFDTSGQVIYSYSRTQTVRGT